MFNIGTTNINTAKMLVLKNFILYFLIDVMLFYLILLFNFNLYVHWSWLIKSLSSYITIFLLFHTYIYN